MVENVIIIGSGPAGLACAVYTAREDFKPLMITGSVPGGQLLLTTVVENMPGFPNGIMGPELIDNMTKQAQKFGTRMVNDDVIDVDFSSKPFKVKTATQTYEAKTVVISTGANARLLGIPSEMDHMGRGVSTCATCMPASSIVVTNPGTKHISEIRAGTRVLTHDGSFREVKEVMRRKYFGKLIILKPRFFRAEPSVMTPNHPVLVRRIYSRTGAYYHEVKWSKPHWVPAGALTKQDILMYPIIRGTKKIGSIKISSLIDVKVDADNQVYLQKETVTSHRVPNQIIVDKDFGRLVGYYLSEGFSHDRGVSFAFNKSETEYVRDVANLIKKKFKLKVGIRREKSVLRVTAHSLILSKFFGKLFGKYSHEKRMPHEFLLLPTDVQAEIIKGEWRGDGCRRKEDFVITTSSRLLLEQLKQILLRLNILPGTEKRKHSTLKYSMIEGRLATFNEEVYQITVGGPWLGQMAKVVGVKHRLIKERKHVNYHAWLKEGYALLPIRKILTKKYNNFVYNLSVQTNNSYVTPNCTVHNCDGAFFKGKDNVVVVGGGDTAMEDSNFLTRFVKQVTIVHRKDTFRASKIMQQHVLTNPKIKVVWNSTVEEILGKDETGVTGVRIKDVNTGKESTIPCQGVFIAIGYDPNTKFLQGKLPLDQKGYVEVENEVMTGVPGVFVAGDVSDHFYRQAGTASASGIKAALRVREYLQSLE